MPEPIATPEGPEVAALKSLPDLLWLQSIAPPVPISAVYFLFKAGQLVYIGQSVNVHARIYAHVGRKDFDRYAFVRCERAQLLAEETRLLRIFRPPLNRPADRRSVQNAAERCEVHPVST
jgi:hypothetical protein